MKWVVLPFSESYSEETKCHEVKIYPFSCNQEYFWTNSIRKWVRINHDLSVLFIFQHSFRIYVLCAHFLFSLIPHFSPKTPFEQRARATNGKYGPVNLSKNENDWEDLKEWLFSKLILADFMSVVMTSFSNQFLHYDVINSVIITEIRLLRWNEQN